MNFEIIGPEAEALLGWHALADALEAGHRLPVAGIGDTFLYRGTDTLLTRSAWIDGMGIAVKSATIFPGNPARGRAAVNGGVMLICDAEGLPEALIDFHLVTRWKTAGDSFLAAMVFALAEGAAIEDAFRFGTAAGAAAVLSPGTGLAHLADIRRLAGSV